MNKLENNTENAEIQGEFTSGELFQAVPATQQPITITGDVEKSGLFDIKVILDEAHFDKLVDFFNENRYNLVSFNKIKID